MDKVKRRAEYYTQTAQTRQVQRRLFITIIIGRLSGVATRTERSDNEENNNSGINRHPTERKDIIIMSTKTGADIQPVGEAQGAKPSKGRGGGGGGGSLFLMIWVGIVTVIALLTLVLSVVALTRETNDSQAASPVISTTTTPDADTEANTGTDTEAATASVFKSHSEQYSVMNFRHFSKHQRQHRTTLMAVYEFGSV